MNNPIKQIIERENGMSVFLLNPAEGVLPEGTGTSRGLARRVNDNPKMAAVSAGEKIAIEAQEKIDHLHYAVERLRDRHIARKNAAVAAAAA
jgi:hypothetical protein